jgi:hypothetical protein
VQQPGLGGEPRLALEVARALLAAEREQPVDGAELGQRVAPPREALVELEARGAQRRLGEPEPGALEVVQDGEAGGRQARGLPDAGPGGRRRGPRKRPDHGGREDVRGDG